jgi:hypothetical protein
MFVRRFPPEYRAARELTVGPQTTTHVMPCGGITAAIRGFQTHVLEQLLARPEYFMGNQRTPRRTPSATLRHVRWVHAGMTTFEQILTSGGRETVGAKSTLANGATGAAV